MGDILLVSTVDLKEHIWEMTLYMKSPQKEYARQRSMPLIRDDLSLDYKLQGGKT